MKNSFLLIAYLILSLNLFGQEPLKPFVYEDILLLDGQKIPVSDQKNKYVVLNIWATWCKYCVKETPVLNELVKKYQNTDGVLFLALAPSISDNSDKIESFLKKKEFLFQHIVPKTSPRFLESIEDLRYPMIIVYNRNGDYVRKFNGELKHRELAKIYKIIDGSEME